MIRTERLLLVPARVEHLIADLEGPEALRRAFGVRVPDGWPPDLYDEDAMRWMLERLAEGAPGAEAFWAYYFVWRAAPEGPLLVGAGGFKGPPREGRVELGYAVVASHRRRGIATEAVRGLLAFAFEHEAVDEVIAETLPDLDASIGVLEKTGFRLVGEGSEPGVIRFSQSRDTGRAAR